MCNFAAAFQVMPLVCDQKAERESGENPEQYPLL